MSEQKCSSQVAQHYVNDLFETLEIRGNNQLLFDQFCSVLMKYSERCVKESWKEIFFSCDLPNGQMAGRLPKMNMVESILLNNRIQRTTAEHNLQKKQDPMPEGTFNTLWKLGKEYADGTIDKKEFDAQINKLTRY